MSTIGFLIEDGTRFRLKRGKWSGEYPIAELERWLAFYKRQAARPKSKGAYASDVAALEKIKRQLAAQSLSQQEELSCAS